MTDAAPRCRDCGAFLASAVCPVCQQFDPPLRRSVLIGVALLGLLTAGLAASAWAGLLWWKWDRWQAQFGPADGPPAQADARSAAVVSGLLVFAAAGVGSSVLVALAGRR